MKVSFSDEQLSPDKIDLPFSNEHINMVSASHIVNLSAASDPTPLLSIGYAKMSSNEHFLPSFHNETDLLVNKKLDISSNEEIDSPYSANINLSSSTNKKKSSNENLNLAFDENTDCSSSCNIDLTSNVHTNVLSDRNNDRLNVRRSSSPLPSKNNYLPNFLTSKKESLPNSLQHFLRRDSSNLSLSSQKFNSLDEEWRSVFRKLSKRTKGEEQRKIKRGPMLQWATALDEGTVFSLEISKEPVTRHKLMRIISEADADKDGYLNEDEFYSLIKEKNAAATPRQQVKLQKYMWVSAYAEKYKLWPPPIVILIISLLQVYFYFYYTTLNNHQIHITGSSLIYNPCQRWQIWRYLTYGLLHDGLIHLVTNLGVQLLVGLPLEMSHSSGRIFLIYLSGVLAGSLGTSLLDPKMFLAGGSGGAYALIFAHLATLILNWEEDQVILGEQLRRREGKITSASHGRLVSILRLAAVLVFAMVDTGLAVYNRLGSIQSTTGYPAHLAGAMAGFTLGVVVLKNRRVKSWQKGLRLACLLMFVSCVVAGIVWNMLDANNGCGGDYIVDTVSSKPD